MCVLYYHNYTGNYTCRKDLSQSQTAFQLLLLVAFDYFKWLNLDCVEANCSYTSAVFVLLQDFIRCFNLFPLNSERGDMKNFQIYIVENDF